MSKPPLKKFHGTMMPAATLHEYSVECARQGLKPAVVTREMITAWVARQHKKGASKP